ncbi:hypothetical protein [Vreelandella zhaodongensis]|uniref:HTH marR-type domain-containing protein n=1 Tax=Vreelandella zhaodongensis TaxID=1176240 RepID=A0ABX2SPE9_VREZH|nr:hypothetical protein [Halomonas zhaodongensis]NYS43439.1 hypothetical protein [Halomonas zhaodongensis]
MDLVNFIAQLDEEPELHAIRLLILISAFSDSNHSSSIGGFTKLAKLDFLLRYPVMLERALEAKGSSVKSVEIKEHELNSVESQMVRYRFGPWDHKYRGLLNILVAKSLVEINVEGRKVLISLTDAGENLALELREMEEFKDYARRSDILKRNFDLKATNLMNFIYKNFPEVISLRSNQRIPT